MLRERSSRGSAAKSRSRDASNGNGERASPPSATTASSLSVATRLGEKIRHLRRIKQLRLKGLADLVGCSESMISKMENDRVNPSIVMLHKLVAALDTNIGYLFSIDAIEDSPVAKAGKRPIIRSDGKQHGGISLERLVPYSENFLLQANIHIIRPGAKSDGVISHEGEELGFVLEGNVELTVGPKSFKLSAGDSFHFRSESSHGYRNIGRTVAKIIWVNTPPTF